MALSYHDICAVTLLLLCAAVEANARLISATHRRGRAMSQYNVEEYKKKAESKTAVCVSYASPDEEAFRPAPVSHGKVFSWWEWSDNVVKYVALGIPNQPVTATKYKDFVNLHLHVGAPRGQNASNPLPLKPAGQPEQSIYSVKSSNGWPVITKGYIDDATVKAHYQAIKPTPALKLNSAWELWLKIEQGVCYFNAHTATFPAGEVRGQIDWPKVVAYHAADAAYLIKDIKIEKPSTSQSKDNEDGYPGQPEQDQNDQWDRFDQAHNDRGAGFDQYRDQLPRFDHKEEDEPSHSDFEEFLSFFQAAGGNPDQDHEQGSGLDRYYDQGSRFDQYHDHDPSHHDEQLSQTESNDFLSYLEADRKSDQYHDQPSTFVQYRNYGSRYSHDQPTRFDQSLDEGLRYDQYRDQESRYDQYRDQGPKYDRYNGR